MPDVRLKFLGPEDRYSEVSVTGQQQVWLKNQSGPVSPGNAALLLATGKFVDVSAASNYVASQGLTLPSRFPTLKNALPIAYKALKSARGGTHTMWAMCRNSTGVGYLGATDKYTAARAKSPANVLAKSLRRLGVTVNTQNFFGDNYVSASPALQTAAVYDPRITMGSGWSVASLTGPGRTAFQNTTNSNALSFSCDSPVDRAICFYASNGASTPANMTLDVGGSALVTMNGGQAAAFRTTAEITLGAQASNYTINIKNSSGTGGCFFVGMVAWNSNDPGISLINIGFAGARSQDFNNVSASWTMGSTYDDLSAAGVSLYLVGEGINDWTAGYSVATRTTQFTNIINLMKAGSLSDVCLVGDPRSDPTVATLALQDSYFAADLAQSEASGVPYISLADVLGYNDGTNAYYADTAGHLTKEGYALVGETIADALVEGLL